MSSPPRRLVRRLPVLAVVGVVLVTGGLVDRAGGSHPSAAVTAQAVQPVPVVAPPGAYSSSWFCAGATDASPNWAAGQIAIANEGTGPVTATVTVVPSSGARVESTLTVGPGDGATVPETVPAGTKWTGAIVDAAGGMVAVSQTVDGPVGRTTSPCATSGSRHWYLPAGQTRVNATDTVLLLNPYPTDSIVDLSFTTDEGEETPQDFTSLDVPPDGLLAVPLGTHLRRRQTIATTVTARTGNVVAWEAEVIGPPPTGAPLVGTTAANSPLADPAYPDSGVAVTLGAPSAGSTWVFPDGLAGNGIDEQYLIYNPSQQTAQVRLSVGLAAGGTAEPFEFAVGPQQETSIVSEMRPRIPGGVPHTAVVVSTNGVPVVAARTVAASNVKVGTTLRSGIGTMMGERLSSAEWIIPSSVTSPGHQGQIVIENPSATRSVVVGVTGRGASATVQVGPGGRAAVTVPAGPDGPFVVKADAVVYVEYDLYGTGTTPSFSLGTAVPTG